MSVRDNIPEIDVAIVEDDLKLSREYAELLNATEGLHCIGVYGSVEDVLKDIEDTLPDVVLMDIGLPGMSGIEGIRNVKAILPSSDVIMLTVYDDDDKVFRSICAGATGYILKDTPPDELVSFVKRIKTGAPMSASIARRVLDMVRHEAGASAADFQLTRRESDILHWLVEGLTEKKIGEKLFISPQTVHSNIKHIYDKLHVHSRSEVVAKAMRTRLFS